MKDFLKNNFLSIIVLILVLFLFIDRNPFGKKETKIETVKSDTVRYYITQPVQYIPQYTPNQTSSQPIINIPPQYQPSNDISTLVQQYKDIVDKFLATNTYKDSITLKDSSGNRVGVVNLEDKVTQNQITSRSPNYQLSFPVTTVTNTITKYEQPKNKFYFMAEVTGNKYQIVNGGNIGLLWQNKKDQLYWIKTGYSTIPFQNPTIQASVGTAFKIKLK